MVVHRAPVQDAQRSGGSLPQRQGSPQRLPAKAAKPLRVGDTVSVRQSPITRTLKVVGLTGRRVGAKLVADFAEDKTPPADLEKLRLAKLQRSDPTHKKPGRPSKRDRRLIHRFTDPGPA